MALEDEGSPTAICQGSPTRTCARTFWRACAVSAIVIAVVVRAIVCSYRCRKVHGGLHLELQQALGLVEVVGEVLALQMLDGLARFQRLCRSTRQRQLVLQHADVYLG